MSEQSAKPYLVRAISEWCADNGFTPYLAVKVDARTRVPMAYVKKGEIVLNISASATRNLTIDNEWVQFSARFAGVSQEVSVPMVAVAGIFAKETGYGFAFATATAQEDGGAAPVEAAEAEAVTSPVSPQAAEAKDKTSAKPKARPKHLQVIK